MNLEHIKKQFETHVLTPVFIRDDFKVFDFGKPPEEKNSFQHRQRWIIDKGTLIVRGDNGAAVYSWNNKGVSLEFLASCNLDYFSEKCLADRDGSRQKRFDSEAAEELIKEIVTDRLADILPEDKFNDYVLKNKTLDDKLEYFREYICLTGEIDPYDWEGLFHFERHSDAYDFMMNGKYEFMFGSDPWEYGLEIYTTTPYYHLAALKVAQEKFPKTF